MNLRLNSNTLLYGVLFVVLSLTSVLPIWITAHFPSQNGPWYLLAAQIMREYQNPQLGYEAFYTISWHPIPHVLHTVLMYVLSYVAPIMIAQKLALTIYALLLPVSIFYFLSFVSPTRKFLGFFAFLMIHNYVFYRGYHNFSLSIPLFFFAFTYWLKHREVMRRRDFAWLAVLSVLVFLAHLFSFLMLVCAITWYEFLNSKSLKSTAKQVLLTTWCGWLCLVDFIVWNRTSNNWIDRSEREWLEPHVAFEYLMRKFFYSTSIPAYVIGGAATMWLVYLFSRRIIRAMSGTDERLGSVLRDPLFSMTLIILVGYFFVPYKMMNWHYINARMIPFILGIGLGAVGALPNWRFAGGFRLAFLGTVVPAALAVHLLMAREVYKLEAHIQNYTSGIELVEFNKLLLPIHLENPQFGQIRPLTRAHEYYQLSKGGANGYGAAYFNTLVPVNYRSYPVETLFPHFNAANQTEALKQAAQVYDYILVHGNDAALFEAIRQSGFSLIHHRENIRLYRIHHGI